MVTIIINAFVTPLSKLTCSKNRNGYHKFTSLLALVMMSRESVALVIMWQANHLEKMKDALAYLKLGLDMATDENKPTKCRGRARGIIAV